MKTTFFSRLNLIRIAIMLVSVAIIMLIVPRTDHQSYSYEAGQPWKYPLLTADFDMPILRDSASARAMRDSIDHAFVPFVKREANIASSNTDRFDNVMRNIASPHEAQLLTLLLRKVYQTGMVEPEVYESLRRSEHKRLRISQSENGGTSVINIDASEMLSPAKAFAMIDSVYAATMDANNTSHLGPEVVKALNICLVPNIVLDTAADTKYRNQEYLNANGALGLIKKGQRIVDRGEIITPQIFTNLNTYQEMQKRNQSNATSHTYFFVGQALYIIICLTLLYMFLYNYRQSFFNDIRKMLFLMTFITFFVVFAVVMFEFFANGLFLVPFAAVPITIMVFFDARTAIFSLITTVLIVALIATFQFQFIFLELCVGLVSTFSIRHLSRRSQLLRTALFSFITYVICYLVLRITIEGNLNSFAWRIIGIFAINGVILSFAYILILVMEKIFGFTSTVTLVELSDINNPVLRRLAEEAPGTFQHSMQVSTLATEAARAIGANTTLVRTGALYHDIGKVESPVFFTENQHGVNPHAGLNPETSAQKIISHVTGGLALAAREKLPTVIKSFISEHHGQGLAKYFYNTAVNENPGKDIDKSLFQYPGPNPQSRETAILMMADCVEAASRSLSDYSPGSINSLVDKIIDSLVADGMFNEAPISLRDINTVKETFKKRLATIYHSRIAYPDLKRGTAPAAAKEEPAKAPVKEGSEAAKPETPAKPESSSATQDTSDSESPAMIDPEAPVPSVPGAENPKASDSITEP